jgi:hypothetical protein
VDEVTALTRGHLALAPAPCPAEVGAECGQLTGRFSLSPGGPRMKFIAFNLYGWAPAALRSSSGLQVLIFYSLRQMGNISRALAGNLKSNCNENFQRKSLN